MDMFEFFFFSERWLSIHLYSICGKVHLSSLLSHDLVIRCPSVSINFNLVRTRLLLIGYLGTYKLYITSTVMEMHLMA